jgi:hypothetical protein
MQLTCDLSGLAPEVRRQIIHNCEREDLAQQAIAWSEQARITKFYQDAAVVGTTKESVGPMTSVMHIALKQLLAAHYGHQTVYQDPDFMKFIMKKHDCFRVREMPTRIQSGYGGLRG